MKWIFAVMLAAMTVPMPGAAEPLEVIASLLPQRGLVARVGGDRVRVTVLVEHGQEPHSFRPSAKRVTELAQAVAWFTSGMRFEEPLKATLKSRSAGPRVVGLDVEGIGVKGLESQCELEEPGHEEAHTWDPHVWTAPLLVGRQAQVVAQTLAAMEPAHASEFNARAAEVEAEARKLNEELAQCLAPLKGTAFYTFHPAFAYFAAAYGLKQVAIENGGREPSAKHLTELIERAREGHVKLVLVQPQQPTRGAERVARAIGAKVAELDPLAEDVFGTARSLAELLKAPQ